MTRGEETERFAAERIETALQGTPYAIYPNVSWTAPTKTGGGAVDGEADLVLAHPEHGLLVLEVKDGEPSRDSRGRWWLGSRPLSRSPFAQAEGNKHALVGALEALPGWRSGARTRAGHGVVLPTADLRSLPRGHVLLGTDANPRLVLDAEAMETPAGIRGWLERIHAFFEGADGRGSPLGADGMRLVDALLAPSGELRRLVRGRILDDAPALVSATHDQRRIVNQTRERRVEVIGPAGSGKSMIAAEKALRLAREGYRTLLVCYNAPLAAALGRELAEAREVAERVGGGLTIATFHRLAELLAVRAGTIESRPTDGRLPDGWLEALPGALGGAIERLPDERFHAVLVDEGQDFDPDWLLLVQSLLRDPDEGVFWVFHDPGQAVRCPDVVGQLGLGYRVHLYENLRNPGSIAALANRFYRGGEAVSALRDADVDPGSAWGPGSGAGTERRYRIVEAEPGRPTVEAVRRELHRLTNTEDVPGWHIAVLTGSSAGKSAVWREREFGNVVLWNGAIDDAGNSLGLAPEELPDDPPDRGTVLFETVRRFKGLERPVIVLCELPTEGERLDELLYIALTRATTELVVVAPPELAGRLRG